MDWGKRIWKLLRTSPRGGDNEAEGLGEVLFACFIFFPLFLVILTVK